MLHIKEKKIESDPAKKRRKYNDDRTSNSNLSSVNSTIVLGIMPNSQETHANLQLMLNHIQLEKIPYTLTSDVKVSLNMVGKQVASCTNPCIFCEASIPLSTDSEAPLLTIGKLKQYHADFINKCGDTKYASLYQNVVNSILLCGFSDDTLVIDVINCCELHILLGVVAKLMKYMEDNFGQSEVDSYLKCLNISRVEYFGKKSLNGNDSKAFIKHIDRFEEFVTSKDKRKKVQLKKAVDCIKSFNKVRILITIK